VVVEEVVDGGDEFVHALHVLHFGVETGEDEEDAGEVVEAVGLQELGGGGVVGAEDEF
jgi:hypothetical protein